MSTRERPADRGRRSTRAQVDRLRADGRAARTAVGLSQQAVGAAIGASHARVGRFERGELRSVDTDFLGAYLAVLGLDLSIRAYPVADPLRDAGQRALLERLRRDVHPGLRWATEVPLPREGDLRAWDAEIRPPSGGWRVRIEAEMRLTDGQALARRLGLKIRDGGPGHVALLIADTRHNRDAVGRLREELRDLLPLDARAILGALRAGEDPGGSGIVVL